MHPRREAGSQSHGTPPESAGPPKDRHEGTMPEGRPLKEGLFALGGGCSHDSSQLARTHGSSPDSPSLRRSPLPRWRRRPPSPTPDATGTLDAGALSNTAPAITRVRRHDLTGVAQAVHGDVGAWTVTDATGGNDGYTITAAAGAPTVAGGTAGHGSTLTAPPSWSDGGGTRPPTTGNRGAAPCHRRRCSPRAPSRSTPPSSTPARARGTSRLPTTGLCRRDPG